MSGLTENIYLLTPEFVLAGLAILVLGIDLFLPEDRKDVIGWISIASLVLVGALSLMMLPGHEESLYGGLVAVDAFSLLFKIVFLLIGVFIILSSMEYIKRNFARQGEFYGLLLFPILFLNQTCPTLEMVKQLRLF